MSEKTLAIVTSELRLERYAVVAVRWIELCPEIVITYCDETLLRGLTARNIIGIVLTSSNAEAGDVTKRSSRGVAPNTLLENPIQTRGNSDRNSQWPNILLRYRLGLTKIRRVAFETLERGVAAGVQMFYSSNALAAVIRALVGA